MKEQDTYVVSYHMERWGSIKETIKAHSPEEAAEKVFTKMRIRRPNAKLKLHNSSTVAERRKRNKALDREYDKIERAVNREIEVANRMGE